MTVKEDILLPPFNLKKISFYSQILELKPGINSPFIQS